ncbi:hypothetical protein [uncultured Methanobrevibacter sp.]|uniref:hypothetical protein n=1 Tax=uncultured Methanobrevibacter sp. TaxID=253161 RepID=UPI0025E811A4|nr:hypothetical protein [uncultured Methanobrevibacter sp.]MBR4591446.1 hypothetical protein [Bacteroidaceae bacterium]
MLNRYGDIPVVLQTPEGRLKNSNPRFTIEDSKFFDDKVNNESDDNKVNCIVV